MSEKSQEQKCVDEEIFLNNEANKREAENHAFELKYRKEIVEHLDRQECARRNIEALERASRCADVFKENDAKRLKDEISIKFLEHLKALEPVK